MLDRESERKSPEKFRRQWKSSGERGHRKSFGKTEKLFRSIPLSQIGFGTRLEILGGARIVLKTSGIFPEKKPGNVPELPEPLGVYYTTYSCRLVLGLQAQSFVGQ